MGGLGEGGLGFGLAHSEVCIGAVTWPDQGTISSDTSLRARSFSNTAK